MIESTRMMLDWLGRDRGVPQAVAAAASMGQATTVALADPASRTKDIRGTGTTGDMTSAIIRGIEREELHAYA
jgi:3-isopropylmalate dehydrogenase